MDDATLAALCIWSEASGEQYEGKVTVGRVIRNRMALHYTSDGTVAGTVLAPDQFSGFYFSMVGGRYTRDARTLAEAEAKAAKMLAVAEHQAVFADCVRAWEDSAAGSGYVGGPEFQKLTPDVVLYLNPTVSRAAWATLDKRVCVIGHHSFFRP